MSAILLRVLLCWFLLTAVCAYGGDLILTGDEAGEHEDIRFPEWAFATIDGPWPKVGMVNVRHPPFNAVGDGITDDTAAINLAFKTVHNGVIYLPAGTYLVSDSISWDDWAMRALHGAGRGRTVIKLKDHCAGFQDAKQPRPLVLTCGSRDGSNSSGSVAFMNSLYFVTLDTGKGNPGAIGLRWFVSNQGTVRHVTIRSGDGQGTHGIFYHGESCGLLFDVTIDGFAVGLHADCSGYSNLVGDTLRFRNQRTAAIQPGHEAMDLNAVTSVNAVPFLNQLTVFGRVTLNQVTATYTGTETNQAAIDLHEKTRLLVRNVRTTGYATAVRLRGQDELPVKDLKTPQTVAWWASEPIASFSKTAAAPLDLPLRQGPDWHSNDFSRWANVGDFLGKASGNLADALQLAIDSGAETVWIPPLPNALCVLDKTVVLRGKTRRLLGFKGFGHNGPRVEPKTFRGPGLRIDDGEAPFVVIDRLTSGNLGLAVNSKRTTVVRDSDLSLIYGTAKAHGELFIDNAIAGVAIGKGTTAWVRQLYPASPPMEQRPVDAPLLPEDRILCDGGTMWILGLYAEGSATLARVRGGGRLELYGYLHQSSGDLGQRPAFINDQSSLFVAHWPRHTWKQQFPVLVEETQGGTRQLLRMDQAGPFHVGRPGP